MSKRVGFIHPIQILRLKKYIAIGSAGKLILSNASACVGSSSPPIIVNIELTGTLSEYMVRMISIISETLPPSPVQIRNQIIPEELSPA